MPPGRSALRGLSQVGAVSWVWDGADADVGREEAVPGMRVPSDVLRHRLKRIVLWAMAMWYAWAWFSTRWVAYNQWVDP